ncbi:MarR family winged helix-turn-helix transcriptional regulator [Nocardioides sp. NPDC101246]|uniref:MarR family winged helix-turn-helix transcriptional regulator n=1 Tax=Nocardioides sp. NPDC101246 TaxID=3364336 RepID=UPI0038275FD6
MSEDGDRLGSELSLHVVMFHEAIARRLGVGNSEHKMLDLVARHPEGITPGELSAATGLSNAAVTKIVDKLVAAEYVRRERSSRDRRSFRIHTTPHFRQTSRPTAAGLAQRIEQMNQRFDQDELAAIGRWVSGVIEALRLETERLESEER